MRLDDLVIDETSGNVHTGELTGEAEVRNGEAVFAYDRANYDKCRILTKLAPRKIELEQAFFLVGHIESERRPWSFIILTYLCFQIIRGVASAQNSCGGS